MTEIIHPETPPIIWICTGCGHYYAAPDFRPDVNPQILQQQYRRRENGEQIPTRARIDCPNPACNGAPRRPYFVVGLSAVPDAVLAKWARCTEPSRPSARPPAIDVRPAERVYEAPADE
jgi:hypothetical protein